MNGSAEGTARDDEKDCSSDAMDCDNEGVGVRTNETVVFVIVCNVVAVGIVVIEKGVLCVTGIILSVLLEVIGSGLVGVASGVSCCPVGATSVGGWGSAEFEGGGSLVVVGAAILSLRDLVGSATVDDDDESPPFKILHICLKRTWAPKFLIRVESSWYWAPTHWSHLWHRSLVVNMSSDLRILQQFQ